MQLAEEHWIRVKCEDGPERRHVAGRRREQHLADDVDDLLEALRRRHVGDLLQVVGAQPHQRVLHRGPCVARRRREVAGRDVEHAQEHQELLRRERAGAPLDLAQPGLAHPEPTGELDLGRRALRPERAHLGGERTAKMIELFR